MFGDYSLGDLGSIFVMQGFAGLILFSVYVLMALGLAIIFGQMGVINMAHGEFMILGAYVTWMTSNAFQQYLPSLFPGYFFVAHAASPAHPQYGGEGEIHYGETVITLAYLREHWSSLFRVLGLDLLLDDPHQVMVTLRRA